VTDPAPGIEWSEIPAQYQGVLEAEARLRRRARIGKIIDQILVMAVLLLVWQGVVDFGLVHQFFISKPTLIAIEVYNLFRTGYILPHLAITSYEAVAGLLLGTVFGMLTGFIAALSQRLASAIEPVIVAFSSMPRVAIAPLFVIWFGFGPDSKIALATLVVYFTVFFNTFAGIRAIEPVLLENIRTMGGSKLHVLRYVIAPYTLAWVFAATKSSISMALISAVVGEFVGARAGIGWVMVQASGALNTTRLFACMIILSVLGSMVFAAVKKLEDRVLQWRPE
jgi:NitT/TauT family transport system permease protein